MVAHAFVEIDQQTIPRRVPPRSGFKVDRVQGGEARSGTARARNPRRSEVGILRATLSSGVMHGHLAAGVGLVHVEEAPQVHSFGTQEADVESGFLGWLKFKPQAGLDSVGRFVVLVKARNHSITEKAATRDCAARAKTQRGGVRVRPGEHAGKRNLCNVGRAGESEQPCGCVQSILIRVAGECPGGAAARRRLAGQQGHWDNPMEKSGATAQDNVVLAAKVIGKTSARIEFCFRAVQHICRKSLKLVAKAIVHAQIVSGLPGMLEIESAIIVRGFSLCLVPHGTGDSLSLEH